MKKKKTFIIMLSKVFPVTHPKAGQDTGFKPKIFAARHNMPCYLKKLHTIRANYPLWKNRIDEVLAGNAELSLRQWTGKPYRSKTVEIMRLTADDGVGIQRLCFYPDRDGAYSFNCFTVDGRYSTKETIAQNDGLSIYDWMEWFRNYDFSKPLAIIHFTKFRY